jgi:hypothetical protein
MAEVSYAVQVNECGIFASRVGFDFWTEQILMRPISRRIKWLALGPSGGLAQIPCEDKEEAEFVRGYMTEHGIRPNHVKVKRIKAEDKANGQVSRG